MGAVSSSTKAAKDEKPSRITSAKAVDDILHQTASKARSFTNADGAAIALNDGDSMLTRASTGSIAPDVGSRIRTEGTFSGLCLKEGTALHCEDSQADPRVDPEVCRALNTRSFIVVPIAGAHAFIGLLAVFSSSARWFTQSDVAMLTTMANQVSQTLGFMPKERSSDEISQIAGSELQAVAEAPSGDIPASRADQHPALFVVEKPQATSPEDESTSIDVAGQPEPTAEITPADYLDVIANKQSQPTPVAEVAGPVESPETPTTIFLPTLQLQARASSREEPVKEGSRRKWLAVFTAIVIVAAALTWISLLLSSPTKSETTAEPLSPAAAPPPVSAAEPPSSMAVAPTTAAPVPTQQAAPLKEAAQKPATPVTDSDRRTSGTATEPALSKAEQEPAERSNGAPIVLAPPTPESAAERGGNEAAPQLAFAPAKPALPEATPAVPVPPATSHGLVPSELIYQVPPRYPSTGSKFGLSGTVVLRANVLRDGSIGAISVIRGGPPFVAAALAAVKQWRYKPARINGTPVESTVEVTVKFDRRM